MEGYPEKPRTQDELAKDILKLYREIEEAESYFTVLHDKAKRKAMRNALRNLGGAIESIDPYAWYRIP